MAVTVNSIGNSSLLFRIAVSSSRLFRMECSPLSKKPLNPFHPVCSYESGMIVSISVRPCTSFSEKEVQGRTLIDTIIPLSYEHTGWNGFKGFLERGEHSILNKRLELTAIRKSKEEFPIELTVTAIQDESECYFSAFIR